jgi:glutamyl-tRNA synthetase
MNYRGRLAPTPSGLLHQGNLLVFAVAWQQCRIAGGKLLLRIDDMDTARRRPAYINDIFSQLNWLGIDWDEGPQNEAEYIASWQQIHRLELYEAALHQLAAKNLVYPCGCSRQQLHKLPLLEHRCREKNIHQAQAGDAWRLRLPENLTIDFTDTFTGKCTVALTKHMPDFVVRKKDGKPAYQICSLVDDLHFNINHIVRGQDLLASTAAQLHLADLLGLGTFKQTHWLHLPLVVDANGNKLSKSQNASPLAEARKKGMKAAEFWQQLEIISAGQLLPKF